MRLTVKQAADRLGYPEQAVRVLMQSGKLPIGEIRGTTRRTYYITAERLERYLRGE